jgi:polysaccharide chain length determinant protein (PEP-CTERM system associated)
MILPAIALFVVATVVISRLPNIYRSETVILVDPQKVPDSLVQSPVSGGASDRLSTIRQLATSPTRLLALIDKLGLYPQVNSQHDRENAVAMMQKDINIDVADYGGQKMSAFKIAFSSESPEEAAKVANGIAAMVIEDNLKARAQAFSGAEQFIDSELEDTKKQLEAKEIEVQRIRTQYVMDLPESKQFHLEALNSLRNQLRASEDRVNQDKQEKVYLQSTANSTAPPTVDLDSGNSPSTSPYQASIQRDESRLAELQIRYGPQYPDVRKLQREIAELKAKAAQDAKDQPQQEQENPTEIAKRALHKNPVLQAQVTRLDEEIAQEVKKQASIQPQIEFHLSKLQREPIFEQQIEGFMRDYDTLRTHYNRLLDKKLSADMAMELENRQQGERFVALDSAPIPQRPASPNRPLFSFAGLIGGLLGGFVLALVVEMNDESVRTEHEAARIFGKPVLGGIPRIISAQERHALRLRMAGVLAGTIVASAALGILISIATRRFL